ncbi:MAG: tRNA epoxyqueuosine(34) reductase QueG [Cyanobacteria bacterium P01_H01_bin.74]
MSAQQHDPVSERDLSQETVAVIYQKAFELGFDAVSIVSAAPMQKETTEALQLWLENGYQAEMGWMQTHFDKRQNPQMLMENTQSLVCVAMNYYTPDTYDPNDPDALKIAKYARGTDYHYVIKDALKALLKAIQAVNPEVNGRALTDSAPIMEKPLAVQAGLGWIGKNGTVLLPGKGSWFFLGELLLDIVLPVKQPEPVNNYCGTCTRCIDACPTEAIVEPGVIDSNRCLAYWTIEYKGEAFPEVIRDNVNGWIFGCDVCQDVCPWNIKFAKPTSIPDFQPRDLLKQPDAEILQGLSPEAFKAVFRKSPIKRAKQSGLNRNIQAAVKK